MTQARALAGSAKKVKKSKQLKRCALLIGVSEFPKAELPPLPGAARDVLALALELSKHPCYGYDMVWTLSDDSPNRKVVKDKVESFCREVRKHGGTMALVYIATHGYYADGCFQLCFSDVQGKGKSLTNALSLRDLQSCLSLLKEDTPHKEVTTGLILDCCRVQDATEVSAPGKEGFCLDGWKHWFVMTSSASGEAAHEFSLLEQSAYRHQQDDEPFVGNHGLFTRELMVEFQKKASHQSREVTVQDFHHGVSKGVTKRIAKLGLELQQTPTLYSCGSAIVLYTRPSAPEIDTCAWELFPGRLDRMITELPDDPILPLLHICAFLAPEPASLPMSVLEENQGHLRTIDEASLGKSKLFHLVEAFSLLRYEEGELQISLFLQKVLEKRMEDERSQYLAACMSFLVDACSQPESFSAHPSLFTHVEVALAHAEAFQVCNPSRVELYYVLGCFVHAQRDYERALQVLKKGKSLCQLESIGEVARFASEIGDVYLSLERYQDALAPLKEAVSIRKRKKNENLLCLVWDMRSLGEAYRQTSCLDEAEMVLLEANELLEADEAGPASVERLELALSCINSLGSVFFEQGKLEEAKACFQQATIEDGYIDHPSVFYFQSNLAVTLEALEKTSI